MILLLEGLFLDIAKDGFNAKSKWGSSNEKVNFGDFY